jgi:hypothetical protein
MNYRKISKWIIGLSIVVLGLVDLWLYLYGENATFSVVITDWSYYTPWVPFAFGVLMGHWFFPPRGSNM